MSIRQILEQKSGKPLITTNPEALVGDAVRNIVENDIGSILVMQGDKMVGLMTLRDIVKGLRYFDAELPNRKVADVMVKNPPLISPDQSIDDVRKLMIEKHVSHLPVVEGEKIIGIISFFDVARFAISETVFENKLLKQYIKNWPTDEGSEEEAK